MTAERDEFLLDRFLSQVGYMLDKPDFTESEMDRLKAMYAAGFDSCEAAEYLEEMSKQ